MSSPYDGIADGVLALLGDLQAQGYSFVTPGNGTIAYNRRRRTGGEPTLRDVFGWNIEFDPAAVRAPQFALWDEAGLFDRGKLWKSRVRVSSLAGRLFAHSTFPTDSRDAVFLGPDSYRFARVIAQELAHASPARILDLGCGAGVGAVIAADLWPEAEVCARDVNPAALTLTRINAAAAQRAVKVSLGSDVPTDLGAFDLILANPPFIADTDARTYRDGGGSLGLDTTLRWARQGAQALSPSGVLLVYAAAPIDDAGTDPLLAGLRTMFPTDAWRLDYEEIDPDIFGGLLGKGAYAACERLAAVTFRLARR